MTKLGPELTKLRVRRFVLQRDRDESETSGVGFVAEGVEFSDGTAVLSWRTMGGSTAVYPDGAEQIERIHGHGGGTVIVWLDDGVTAKPLPAATADGELDVIGVDASNDLIVGVMVGVLCAALLAALVLLA